MLIVFYYIFSKIFYLCNFCIKYNIFLYALTMFFIVNIFIINAKFIKFILIFFKLDIKFTLSFNILVVISYSLVIKVFLFFLTKF